MQLLDVRADPWNVQRCSPFLLLFFSIFPSSARAQSPAAEEEGAVDSTGTWDAPWVSSWDVPPCCQHGEVRLDLRAGQRRSHFLTGQEGFGIESYVLAQLSLPLQMLWGRRPGERGVGAGGLAQPAIRPLDDLLLLEHFGGEGGRDAPEDPEWGTPTERFPTVASRTVDRVAVRRGGMGVGRSVPSESLASQPVASQPVASQLPAGQSSTDPDVEDAAHAVEVPEKQSGPSSRQSARDGGGSPFVREDALDPPRDPGGAPLPPVPTSFALEVLERAARQAGWDGALGRLDSVARRSRSSGLLPELRLRGVGGLDQIHSFDSGSYLPVDGTQRNATDTLLEVRLTFHLERLLFGDEEPGVERLRAQLLRERNGVMGDVLELLVDWDEARQELARDDLHDDERWEQERDLRRLGVVLDVLTGGWFQGAVQKELASQRAHRARRPRLGSRDPGR